MDYDRQLKIREGVVRRLTKELAMYKEEVEQGEVALSKISDSEDNAEWRRGYQGKLIDESKKLVLDTQQRLSSAEKQLNELRKD
ncbi:hypothetical protein E3P99_03009 [Wallemia hederae]|uniref:Tubulin-specific chaperone A n=1 Tax=Wallemia hederae TaxID=1540922 RepID=A0A4V4LTG7_9BASI|nr:hypothetical protein E3P99_03009 [Wallemia hederae]